MGLSISIPAFGDGERIPDRYAFCNPGGMGPNVNPAISWSGAPDGTRSFALVMWDPDVPTVADDVNQEGRSVSADLPRTDFCHWVLIDIPASETGIAEGVASDGVTARGKDHASAHAGQHGLNHYTHWFEGDEEMGGQYHGYDGPCPPWNDELVHRYVFGIYAIDVETLGLPSSFSAADARAAMDGHVLDEATWTGTYTLNPSLL